jgi:hypothetical protein
MFPIDPHNSYYGDAHGEVTSNVDVKQQCPLFPHIIQLTMYIDKLKIYLNKIDMDSPCLINAVIVIILYVDNVVLLFESRASLQ